MLKKKVYQQHGNYNISLGNSSDFDLMYRFLEINKIHSIYIDKIIVSMRYGGKSNKNIKTILSQNLIIFNISINYLKLLA